MLCFSIDPRMYLVIGALTILPHLLDDQETMSQTRRTKMRFKCCEQCLCCEQTCASLHQLGHMVILASHHRTVLQRNLRLHPVRSVRSRVRVGHVRM